MDAVFAFSLGPMEMLIVGVVAVLLFGGRLPEVGRSLGKSLSEFRKGFRDIEDQIRGAVNETDTASVQPARRSETEEREEATAPKFEPPPAETCVGKAEEANP